MRERENRERERERESHTETSQSGRANKKHQRASINMENSSTNLFDL